MKNELGEALIPCVPEKSGLKKIANKINMVLQIKVLYTKFCCLIYNCHIVYVPLEKITGMIFIN